MIAPDANILVFAMNRGAPEHLRAKAWLDAALSGEEQVAFTWGTLLGFIRIVTNSRICQEPLSVKQAFDVAAGWLAEPIVRMLLPGPNHLMVVRELLEAAGTGGNLTPDADLAALSIESGSVVASADRDFARFPGVRWQNPLA